MSDRTAIEWTATVNADGSVTPGATWNPIKARRKDTGKVGWHCERVSPACAHCYAAAMNRRNLKVGTGLDYTRTSRDLVDIFIDEKALLAPLKWKRGRKVFVCSMTDLFAEFVPFELVDRVFAVMALASRHAFQVLTKRPDRMAEYMNESKIGRAGFVEGRAKAIARDVCKIMDGVYLKWPLENVWLGCTCESQEWADKRIPHLLKCPAAVRFLSVEPMLGPVLVGEYLGSVLEDSAGIDNRGWPLDGIDWVIAGGESGRNARPMHPDWARSLRDQCERAGVPFFFKQWGEWLPISDAPIEVMQAANRYKQTGLLRSGASGDQVTKELCDAQDDLPELCYRVGKHAAGRLLDEREWNELPAALAVAEAAR